MITKYRLITPEGETYPANFRAIKNALRRVSVPKDLSMLVLPPSMGELRKVKDAPPAYDDTTQQLIRQGFVASDDPDFDEEVLYTIEDLPEPSLDELKDQKLQQLDALVDQHLNGGVTLAGSGVEVATDSEARADIMALAKEAEVDPDYRIRYRSEAGKRYILNREQILGMYSKLAAWVRSVREYEYYTAEAIEACTTRDELDAVDLVSALPSNDSV